MHAPKPLSPDAPFIPIVLGVVGHRDIDPAAEAALRASLQEVFDQFDDAYKDSPKVLLSPLAPGADQLAADVALARGPQWSVRAPLPFHPDDARKSTTFHLGAGGIDQAALDRFDQLIVNPRVEWFVVPLPDSILVAGGTAGRRPADWVLTATTEGERPLDWNAMLTAPSKMDPALADFRRACYANAGGYIVRHCHTLIALWDGGDVQRPSGTAEVVRFQLGGLAPAHYPWTPFVPLGFDGDRGPVIWLRTPRQKKPTEAAGPAEPSGLPAATGPWEVLVPSAAKGMCFGQVVDLPQLAHRPSSWKRFWARVWHTLGWDRKPSDGPKDTDSRPGPWRPPEPQTESPEYDQFLTLCHVLDDFNAEAGREFAHVGSDPAYAKRLQGADAAVAAAFPPSDPTRIPDASLPMDRAYARFLRVRETAGHLAGRLDRRHRRIGWALFLFLFCALLMFHLYAHPPWHLDHEKPVEHSWGLLAGFLGCWAVLGGLVCHAWWTRLDDRRHDYRALAEGLRVRQAYAVAGLARSVADTYFGQLRSELSWIRRALQHLCPPPEFWDRQFRPLPASRQAGRLAWVRQAWVGQQEKYYTKERKTKHHSAVWDRKYGLLLAVVGLILLALPLCGLVSGSKPQPAPVAVTPPSAAEPTPEAVAEEASPQPAEHGFWYYLHPARPLNTLLLAGTMFVILGGLFVAVCERRSHEQLAKQYDQMYAVFRGGGRELDAVLSPAAGAGPLDLSRAQRVIEELGRESLQENATWLLVARSKPLELPLGA